jgi:hypothetical protein
MATIIIMPNRKPILLKSIVSIINSKLSVVVTEPRINAIATMIMDPRREIEVRWSISKDSIT